MTQPRRAVKINAESLSRREKIGSLGIRVVELKLTTDPAETQDKGSLGFRMVELKSTANSANSREKIKKSV